MKTLYVTIRDNFCGIEMTCPVSQLSMFDMDNITIVRYMY